MQRIVAGIETIEQHLEAIKQTPEAYRPPCCPHCGLKILWQHGHYERKADRRADTVCSCHWNGRSGLITAPIYHQEWL